MYIKCMRERDKIKNWARKSENYRKKNMKRRWELRKAGRWYVRKRIRFPAWLQNAGFHCHNTPPDHKDMVTHVCSCRESSPTRGDSLTLSSTSFLLYLLCCSFYAFTFAESVLLILLSPRTCECRCVHARLWEVWLMCFLTSFKVPPLIPFLFVFIPISMMTVHLFCSFS